MQEMGKKRKGLPLHVCPVARLLSLLSLVQGPGLAMPRGVLFETICPMPCLTWARHAGLTKEHTMKRDDTTLPAPTRRHFLRLGICSALALGAMPLAGSPVLAAGKGEGVLVAYFSYSGNTRTIAEMIHQRVGGDIVEIKAVKPYPADYDACVEQAKQELSANAYPQISTVIPDMGKYRTVFLGYPCWWGTMPRAVFTFLKTYSLNGKTVAPFCTHGGSGMGSSEADIRRLCPGARLLEGLPVRGRSVKSAGKTVDAWLQSIVF